MTRRIVAAIMLVTALAVAAFGIPLGIIIQRLRLQEQTVRLERETTTAAIEVPTDLGNEKDGPHLPERDGVTYGLYLPDGRRSIGSGPERADEVVRQALRGQVATVHGDDEIVVAVPAYNREELVAVVRARVSTEPLEVRIARTWLGMAVLAVGVVAGAGALAYGLARRLHRPVQDLVRVATELGDGDFAARADHSGIAELDDAIDALAATALRLGAMVERERAFSADASHQLRTPLTGLRVNLEELSQDGVPSDGRIERALVEVDRLERTIADLLALARDRAPTRAAVDLDAIFAELDHAWGWRLERQDRALEVRHGQDLPMAHVSTAAIRQILDVLVSNALEHGAGTVTVTAREVADSLAIDVADEGTVRLADPDRLFVRRSSDRPGHGIGLALARTLAEAEGGRLLLRNPGPGVTFTLLLPNTG